MKCPGITQQVVESGRSSGARSVQGSVIGALHVYYGDNRDNFDYVKFIRVAGSRRGTVVLSTVRSESWEE